MGNNFDGRKIALEKNLLDVAKQFLFRRRQSYQDTFRAPVAKVVLKDLALFCRANASTFHDSDRVQAKLDGRREVWLRIAEYLRLTPDELWELHRPDRGEG